LLLLSLSSRSDSLSCLTFEDLWPIFGSRPGASHSLYWRIGQ
jgi:hypothetical protein